MIETVLQGHDLPLEFEIYDEITGAAIKPSTLVDYNFYLYKDNMRKELELSFKKTPSTNEHQIKVENDMAGIISIVIPRSWTKSAEPKTYYLEFKRRMVAGSEFENEEFVSGQDLAALFQLNIEESSNFNEMT